MAPAQSSLSKPNLDDQMRRVSVVIYQHICRSEKKRKAREERAAQGPAAPPLPPDEEEEKEEDENLVALFGEDQ